MNRQDANWTRPTGNVYLTRQAIGSGDPSPASSILFADSSHLSVNGISGSVTTELIRIEDRGVTLGRVISSGHEIELKDSGNFTLLLPSEGRLDIQVGGFEYRSVPGCPIAFRPTERRTRASSMVGGRFRATTLQVSSKRLGFLAARAGLSVETAFAKDANALSGVVGQYLARQLPLFADEIFRRPDAPLPVKVIDQIANLIDEQLCEIIGVIVESPSTKCILPAFHRVRQAEELMQARSDEPFSMLDLAALLDVSLRSLQLAFQEVHDASPRHILNQIRLEKARHRLLAANDEDKVTTVALDSGFFHLGRFAQAYAQVYGERPSETLARRRA